MLSAPLNAQEHMNIWRNVESTLDATVFAHAGGMGGAMLFCQKVQSGGPDELPLSVEQIPMVPTGPVLITFPLFLPAGPTIVTHSTWNATKATFRRTTVLFD